MDRFDREGAAFRLRRERVLTRVLLGVTLVASALVGHDLVVGLAGHLRGGAFGRAGEQLAFLGALAILLYGNLVYQATRLGLLARRLQHRSTRRAALERVHEEDEAPPLAILVPSYKEELDVVRKTLLSAALQEYPRRRVVLLIDDAPQPADPEAAAALAATRSLPKEIAEVLEKPARRFGDALADFGARHRAGALDLAEETGGLAALCAEAAAWLEARAANHPERDHTDRLFVELTYREPAREERRRMQRLQADLARGTLPSPERLLREHRRLAARFRVEVTAFERKRYANLSPEPNKAMNLNSYIDLLGRSFREVERDGRLHLAPAEPAGAAIHVPDAEFLVTLDADSVLTPDYALRLVHRMRRPGNERVAVAQTPYSAFPGAPGVLERVAGATTDVQYRIHQGFTRFDGTYWVGANAVLRTRALRDLRTLRRERGHEVAVFIQDRTVIEDTESTVDLIARGWTLHNHPERLAWSATPPDFGSLLVQRRRWANGGLLILPKLVRHLRRGPWSRAKLAEGWVRAHYLVSIAGVNAALLVLLLWPFEHALGGVWLPLAALPYFALYGRDLRRLGYPAGDLARVYALNLLLLPVQLAGVARSLQQAVTGRGTLFARTPKVPGRTPAPAAYHLAGWGLLCALAATGALDVAHGRWIHASFVAANGLLLGYALVRLAGLGATADDLRLALRGPASLARDANAARASG